jgi:cardiolipin synthase
MTLLLVLGYLATWAAVPHLLLLKKRPTATLAWLWAILFMPYLGTIVYGLFGTDRLKRRRLKRRLWFSARPSSQPAPAGTTDAATSDLVAQLPDRDRRFLHLLSRINQLPVSSCATLRIHRDATAFYPALAHEIRQARAQLHLQFYLWRPDATGERFLRQLTEAAERGVVVRLLLDGVGSFGLRRSQLRAFRAAGGRFAWFQSLDPRRGRFVLNLRNHRKLQVIDGTTAFVGGMNIGREYEGLEPRYGHWRDVQVEATGSVVRTLQECLPTTGSSRPENEFRSRPPGSRRPCIPRT